MMLELVGIAGFIAQCVLVIRQHSIATHNIALREYQEIQRLQNEFNFRLRSLEFELSRLIQLENERANYESLVGSIHSYS
ncbi:hypothetical protein HYPBUDRAFT_231113 [Hyphopichia burtonii NRRL Y-1933]|uniref:Uncharacterized protein n=1 Tax=Hyphopichia burtonii NRRL Y-1933 TaxID=984485 RepID=A0A1E4RD79_9ASCO|nr:hypothetical protein HYPBUDRAFT_231113 [Hyphopichia burtonii NRRL Y-1933]ODV65183.1 hypothetical protein HYPBUDRAFT_231113 [Hyphopichia burtonii NRRL Y-1933]